MKAINRLIEYLDYKGIKPTRFEKKIGLSNGYLGTQMKRNADLGESIINKIIDNSLDLNVVWLLTGKGDMLKDDTPQQTDIVELQYSVSQFKQRGYAPYYSSLPVSAGKFDLMNIEQRETPESWIKFPGVDADSWFPVIGCSMEPKIYAGDIVGVKQLDNWERLDPDKTYLIITHDDRMIKHLETDEADNNILWAISDNYKRFKITKKDIIRIFRVVWAGRFI